MSGSTPSPDLTGRVALVTGGTSGIGKAIVDALAAAGATVALTSRDPERARAAAAEIADARGAHVVGVGCDVRDASACRRAVGEVAELLGGLDVLVNNAGVGVFKPTQELSEEEWRLQVETNLHGVFFCTKAALPHLEASGAAGDGRAWIINIGSLASRNSFGRGAGYNASKFGLLGMTEAMMIDLRYLGIRTSIVMPGSVDTAFADHAGEDRAWALRPDDVADAVLQLLTFPASAMVSRVEMRPSKPPRR